MRGAVTLLLLSAHTVMIGCGPTVKVDPIRVEPIHITLDVNIRLDKKLNDIFDFLGQEGA